MDNWITEERWGSGTRIIPINQKCSVGSFTLYWKAEVARGNGYWDCALFFTEYSAREYVEWKVGKRERKDETSHANEG